MGSGRLDPGVILHLAAKVRCVAGDIAEVGVWKGDTFRHFVNLADVRGCRAHAFDSFAGMSEPGANDSQDYPAGRFDIGGVDGFRRIMRSRGFSDGGYSLWPGFIPDCFAACDARFALAYLDVDHEEPTQQAIAWLWARLAPEGILVCDDYNPAWKHGASLAISTWLASGVPGKIVWIDNDQIAVQKHGDAEPDNVSDI